MQMSDYVHSKRLIPDFGTWVQCFMTYTAVLLAKHPGRATSLLLYAGNIAQLSQRWRWPSWVVYDNASRKRAADKGEKDWSELDGGLHAQCFNTGMALNAEGWCKWCHSMDHLSTHCPFKPPASKRPAYQPPTSSSTAPNPPNSMGGANSPICGEYNKSQWGECMFGSKCKYQHVCRRCRAEHPAAVCPLALRKPQSK